MITVLTQENAHLYGPALPEMYRLRQSQFIDRQNWNIPSWNGMEYDAFDNPATTYLIYRSEKGKVHGVSRLYPTDRPYMISEIWPDLVENTDLPHSLSVWEGSRFAIDKELPAEMRKRIKNEIVCAYLEFSLARNIEKIIGVMPPAIWRSVFQNAGWTPIPLGKTILTDERVKIFAAELPVSAENLTAVRKKTGTYRPVIMEEEYYEQSNKMAA